MTDGFFNKYFMKISNIFGWDFDTGI